MDAIAPWHIIVVAAVGLVLFFGWKQLPDMSRSLGRSLRIFKTEITGVADDAAATTTEPAQPVTTTQLATPVQPVVVRDAVQSLPVAHADRNH